MSNQLDTQATPPLVPQLSKINSTGENAIKNKPYQSQNYTTKHHHPNQMKQQQIDQIMGIVANQKIDPKNDTPINMKDVTLIRQVIKQRQEDGEGSNVKSENQTPVQTMTTPKPYNKPFNPPAVSFRKSKVGASDKKRSAILHH